MRPIGPHSRRYQGRGPKTGTGQISLHEISGPTSYLLAKAGQRPQLADLSATLDAGSRQLRLRVDRAKAETLGVPIQDVYDAVQTLFGSLSASQYTKYSRERHQKAQRVVSPHWETVR